MFVWAKDFGTGATVKKGVWTGSYNLNVDFGDGVGARNYDAAGGGLALSPIRYRVGLFVMGYEGSLAVTPETLEIILGYNTTNAPVDLNCLIFKSDGMQYIGVRRFFKGFVDFSDVVLDKQGGADSIRFKLVSQMRKGEWTRSGKKSNQSQKDRQATDDFRKYSNTGDVANDPWGVIEE